MTASFEKIDYSLRPAKYAERRMLRDIFRRLSAFEPTENYSYVGFGSVWFSDFTLFHRALGVRDMISIEKAIGAQARIEKNRPFRIVLDFRHSNAALSELDWATRKFIWLDYDDALRPEMMGDIRAVARKARSGSILAISTMCSEAREFSQAAGDDGEDSLQAIERFRESFSREQIPDGTFDDDLIGWPFASLSRKMMLSEIESALATRKPKAGPERMLFTPICSFEYADHALMTTVVGIFQTEADQSKVEECDFGSLDFISDRGQLVRIEIPRLTIREILYLESQLPLPADTELTLETIPEIEARRFDEFYRYLPNFAVIES